MAALPTPHGTSVNLLLVALLIVSGTVNLAIGQHDVGLSLVNVAVGVVVSSGVSTVAKVVTSPDDGNIAKK